MSETNTSASYINDKDLAFDMANAWKPYMDLAKEAEKVGLTDAVDSLSSLGNNAMDSVQIEYVSDDNSAIQSEHVEQPGEFSVEREKIKEVIAGATEQAGVFMNGWIDGSEVAREKKEGNLRFQGVFSDKAMNFSDALLYGKMSRVSDSMKDKFLEQGATEHVLVQRLNIPIGTYTEAATHPNEPTIGIKYELTTDSRANASDNFINRRKEFQTARSSAGAEAQDLFVVIMLPESKANEVLELAQKDPSVYRDLVDSAVRNRLGMIESWWDDSKEQGERQSKTMKPPYEAWKQLNGGMNKIAITDQAHGIDTTVVEF